MTAFTAPKRSRNRVKRAFQRRNPILHFQKVHKAIVKFHTTKMSPYSAHNIIKCEMINVAGIKTHAYGASYQEAFKNMKSMYNQKLAS